MRNQIMHLIKGELIGKQVTVITETKELKGTIIDETKNMFTIKIKNKEKKIIKKNKKFQFKIANKQITIIGEKLIGSPEERIKSK